MPVASYNKAFTKLAKMKVRGSGGRTALYNTVFATLAKIEAVGTRRKYPGRSLKTPKILALSTVFKKGNTKKELWILPET
jgi:hypothetical protein